MTLLSNAHRKGQSLLEYAMLLAIVAAACMAMNTYVQRALQGNINQLDSHITARPLYMGTGSVSSSGFVPTTPITTTTTTTPTSPGFATGGVDGGGGPSSGDNGGGTTSGNNGGPGDGGNSGGFGPAAPGGDGSGSVGNA